VSAHPPDQALPYLPGMDFEQYLGWARDRHPGLAELLSADKYEVARASGVYDDGAGDMAFEEHAGGSRGQAYRSTQLANPLIRKRGIDTLYRLVTKGLANSPDTIVVDALGGNGTLANAVGLLYPGQDMPKMITADISAAMIRSAIDLDRPAIRQSAAYPLFADETLDGVIFAYGTHHIPISQRALAMDATFRVLKPGGRIVVQDFEIGTPTERWYSELLDIYTVTAHPHTHFTREGIVQLVEGAGFTNIELMDVYDPCVAFGESPDAARIAVLSYLVNVFDLKLPRGDELDVAGWIEAENIVKPYARFDQVQPPVEVSEFSVYPTENGYCAEYPRVAMVVVGEKPASQ
jgi:ubiquinone/menaquinone biosynthesis C-methylase UbiE